MKRGRTRSRHSCCSAPGPSSPAPAAKRSMNMPGRSSAPRSKTSAIQHWRLEYANRAIERAGSPNPVYLHTLGWAHYRLGHKDEAVQTLEQALKTLPPAATGPAVGLRRQIEADLATFKAPREGFAARHRALPDEAGFA